MQAHLKRVCMWTREHVYVSAGVWVRKMTGCPSVCVFIPESGSPLVCI